MSVPGVRWRRRQHLRQAEVEDLREAFSGNHDVPRLEIAVDHTHFMSAREPVGDLLGDVQQLLDRERAPGQQLGQRHAVHELHGDVRDRIGGTDVINRQDVRVVERRGRTGFRFQSFQPLGIRGQGRRQDLDGDVPAEARVPRPVHLPHPARAERRQDLVGAKTRAGGERQSSRIIRRGNAPLSECREGFTVDANPSVSCSWNAAARD